MTNYNENEDDIIVIQLLVYEVAHTDELRYIKPKITLDSLGAGKDLVCGASR